MVEFLIIRDEFRNEKNAKDNRLDKIAEVMAELGNLTILYPGDSNNTTKLKNITSIQYKSSNLRMIRRFIQIKKLKATCLKNSKNKNYDIIYTQEPYNALAFKNFRNSIKIFDVIGLNFRESSKDKSGLLKHIKSKYFQLIEKKALESANVIFTVNQAHKNEIKKLVKKEIIVLRDGVDDEFFSKTKSNKKNKEILFVGTLFKNRLKDLFIAAPSILTRHNNVTINIVGNGPDIETYKSLAKKHGNRIIFSGFKNKIQLHSEIKNAYLCFSDDWSYIGFPTKVYEYMAMSRPVIVENTPAVREEIQDGLTGLLYKTPEELVNKVSCLITNEKLAQKIGLAGHLYAKKCSWKIRKEQISSTIRKILKTKGFKNLP